MIEQIEEKNQRLVRKYAYFAEKHKKLELEMYFLWYASHYIRTHNFNSKAIVDSYFDGTWGRNTRDSSLFTTINEFFTAYEQGIIVDFLIIRGILENKDKK